MSATPLTETRRSKVMRSLIGALNPAITALLGSRVGGRMNKSLLLLRFQGRKSGRWYTTPVGFVRVDDRCILVTSRSYQWWKNVRHGADVTVRVDGAWHAARARVVPPDDPEYATIVAQQVAARGPGMLRGFGVPVDDDGRVPEEARGDADKQALLVEVVLGPTIEAPGT